MYHQLHRVLSEANVRDKYDVVIVDSAGKAGPILYNALVAVRNVVIPFEATAKGQESIEGLDDLVDGLEEKPLILTWECLQSSRLGIRTHVTRKKFWQISVGVDSQFPLLLCERGSLMEGCWKQQCSPYRYVEEHRSRKRDYETETLNQFDELARHLERGKQGLRFQR